MVYKLLGILVWNGLKVVLRRKYGRAMVPKPVLGGFVVLLVGAGALVARSRASQ